MSGHRAARHLRTGSGNAGSGSGSSSAAALLAAGEADFRAKMARFKGGAAASKASTALQAHRRAWLAEGAKLAKASRVVDSELTATCNALQTDGLGGGGSNDAAVLLRETLSERAQLAEETRRCAADLVAQTRRARAMLRALRIQRRAEMEEEKLTAPTKALAPKRSRHTTTAAAAAAASHAAAAESAAATAAAAARAAPLSALLTSLSNHTSLQRAALAAEERMLVLQLQPLHDSLALFEQDVSSETAEEALSVSHTRQPSLSAETLDDNDQLEPEQAGEDEANEEEEEEQEREPPQGEDGPDDAEAQRTDESPLEELPMPDEEGNDTVSLEQPQRTFLTGVSGGAAAVAPRHQHQRQPSSARPSSSASFTGAAAVPWPPIPPLDPAVAANLPESLVAAQHAARQALWMQAREAEVHEQARHVGALAALRDSVQRECAPFRVAVDRSDRAVRWGPDQQARLRHLVTSYRGQGQSHAKLIDRLRLEFAAEAHALAKAAKGGASGSSGSAQLCLSERVELLERSRALALQRASLVSSYEADRAARVDRARASLADSDRACIAQWERSEAAREQAESQQVLHAELGVLRAEKAERDRVELERRQEREAEEAAERALRDQREQALRERQRQLLALYHAHQEAEAAEASRAAERARAAQAEQARADIEARKPAVERRQELIVQRREAAAAREAEEAAEVAAREARLDALRALVLPAVERDPARATAATAASAAEDLSNNPLFAVHGYDMSGLLKDKRFRIQLALWNAGMHQTDYGKQVVASAQPAHQPRRDMASNVFSAHQA